jgi:hypothetical protein
MKKDILTNYFKVRYRELLATTEPNVYFITFICWPFRSTLINSVVVWVHVIFPFGTLSILILYITPVVVYIRTASYIHVINMLKNIRFNNK